MTLTPEPYSEGLLPQGILLSGNLQGFPRGHKSRGFLWGGNVSPPFPVCVSLTWSVPTESQGRCAEHPAAWRQGLHPWLPPALLLACTAPQVASYSGCHPTNIRQ